MKLSPNNQALVIRPAGDHDRIFLEKLHASTRDDLTLIDEHPDFIEGLIQQQYRAQTEGYGNQFPNAMYFIVEKHQQAIGKVTVDFGHNEVRVIEIAFIREARGKGLGEEIIRCLQNAATQVATPLTLSVFSGNWQAKNFYLAMGFVVEDVQPPYEFMVWYPAAQKISV